MSLAPVPLENFLAELTLIRASLDEPQAEWSEAFRYSILQRGTDDAIADIAPGAFAPLAPAPAKTKGSSSAANLTAGPPAPPTALVNATAPLVPPSPPGTNGTDPLPPPVPVNNTDPVASANTTGGLPALPANLVNATAPIAPSPPPAANGTHPLVPPAPALNATGATTAANLTGGPPAPPPGLVNATAPLAPPLVPNGTDPLANVTGPAAGLAPSRATLNDKGPLAQLASATDLNSLASADLCGTPRRRQPSRRLGRLLMPALSRGCLKRSETSR